MIFLLYKSFTKTLKNISSRDVGVELLRSDRETPDRVVWGQGELRGLAETEILENIGEHQEDSILGHNLSNTFPLSVWERLEPLVLGFNYSFVLILTNKTWTTRPLSRNLSGRKFSGSIHISFLRWREYRFIWTKLPAIKVILGHSLPPRVCWPAGRVRSPTVTGWGIFRGGAMGRTEARRDTWRW